MPLQDEFNSELPAKMHQHDKLPAESNMDKL